MPINNITVGVGSEEVEYMENINLRHKSDKANAIAASANRTLGNQKENTTKGQKDKTSVVKGTKDKLEISQEALQKYREQLFVQQQMDAMRAQEEQKKDSEDDIGKIMTIFRRIAHGDKVPAKDEQKLMEYSHEMYMAAKMAASIAKNKHPKKYKSLYNDDKENSLRIEEEGSADTVESNTQSAPAPETSESEI